MISRLFTSFGTELGSLQAGFNRMAEGLRELHASDAAVGWLLAADPLGFVFGTYVLSRFVSAEHRVRIVGTLATASCACPRDTPRLLRSVRC